MDCTAFCFGIVVSCSGVNDDIPVVPVRRCCHNASAVCGIVDYGSYDVTVFLEFGVLCCFDYRGVFMCFFSAGVSVCKGEISRTGCGVLCLYRCHASSLSGDTSSELYRIAGHEAAKYTLCVNASVDVFAPCGFPVPAVYCGN